MSNHRSNIDPLLEQPSLHDGTATRAGSRDERDRPARRDRTVLAIVTVLLFAVACGGGRIILNLDVFSFLDEADTRTNYDETVPPGVGWLPLVTIVPPTEINLIEGMGSVTVLEEGVLTVEGLLDNVLGTATARLRLHVAATAQEVLLSASPLLSTTVSVTPGAVSPFAGTVTLDDATLDLFGGESVWVRVDVQVQVPSATVPTQVQGEARLTVLRARLVSAEDLFD